MRFILLTGMSGAGKTVAIRYLEDMGALCIDNLPPMMMMKLMEACTGPDIRHKMVALSVDVRGGEFFDAAGVSRVMDEMRKLGCEIETIFMEASDDVLVSRYKETRRDHPLSAGGELSLPAAIALERDMLQPLRETANYIIDTSVMKPKTLHTKLRSIVSGDSAPAPIRVEVVSFGFKRGLPRQADLVYDVRFLPNPFYIDDLCRHSGLDDDVRDFVMSFDVTKEFLERTVSMLDFLLPHYRDEGKHRLVVAVGCTGGAHRSVAIAEAIGKHLQEKGIDTAIHHRDLELEQARWHTDENRNDA